MANMMTTGVRMSWACLFSFNLRQTGALLVLLSFEKI